MRRFKSPADPCFPPHVRRHRDSGLPSSAGLRENDGEVSSYHESHTNRLLRDQIQELSSRMRSLETQLLEQYNPSPSSPTRDHNNNHDDANNGGQLSSVRQSNGHHDHHDRGHGYPSRRVKGAMRASSLAAGATRAAARNFAQEDGVSARGGSGGGGYKQGSQDDLVYRSPERHIRTGNLSKKSWPPAMARGITVAAAAEGRGGVRMHAHSGSHSSSVSSSESSLVFAARELTTASPHPRRWEGGQDATARTALGGRSSGSGGGGGVEGERRKLGRRRGGGSGKKSNGNPPGIVLI